MFIPILCSAKHTYTHSQALRPLPLGAGWLPRLQCRLSFSCCYETQTDRPELNDNVSVALARGPQQPIRDSLDKHFPVWGTGDCWMIVWVGRRFLSSVRSSLLAVFFHIRRLAEQMCQSLSIKCLWRLLISKLPQDRKMKKNPDYSYLHMRMDLG